MSPTGNQLMEENEQKIQVGNRSESQTLVPAPASAPMPTSTLVPSPRPSLVQAAALVPARPHTQAPSAGESLALAASWE